MSISDMLMIEEHPTRWYDFISNYCDALTKCAVEGRIFLFLMMIVLGVTVTGLGMIMSIFGLVIVLLLSAAVVESFPYSVIVPSLIGAMISALYFYLRSKGKAIEIV